jgi:hypothetical protein
MAIEEVQASAGSARHVAADSSLPAGAGATLELFNIERPLSSL